MTEWSELAVFNDEIAWEDAQAALEEAELSDGLPLVPPTRRRLQAMLAGIADPDRSYGQMPPLFGEITPRSVAYNCVLAGCRPEELPVVLTAAAACIETPFNLLGILTTTGTACVATVVHGPIAKRLAMNADINMLGPGNRANACVGRAIALVLRNIGGARAGIGDMATMGQPGKYGFCFAESDAAILPSFAVRHGLPPEASAVTVLGVSGTAEILPAGDPSSPEIILAPVAHAMASSVAVCSMARREERGEQVFLLPPEMAEHIVRHGWDVARLQDWMFEETRRHDPRAAAQSPRHIHPIVAGGAGVKMTHLPLWGGGTSPVTTPVIRL